CSIFRPQPSRNEMKLSQSVRRAPAARRAWPAAIGIAFTIVLLGVLLLVASAGHLSLPLRHPEVLVYLLAFGIYILLALLERALPPAGPRKSFDDWLLNFQINIFTGTFFVLGGVALGLLIKALNQYFRLGWIDLRFAHGRGAATLIGVFLLSGFVGDFFYYWY